jgi:hypothetical protein
MERALAKRYLCGIAQDPRLILSRLSRVKSPNPACAGGTVRHCSIGTGLLAASSTSCLRPLCYPGEGACVTASNCPESKIPLKSSDCSDWSGISTEEVRDITGDIKGDPGSGLSQALLFSSICAAIPAKAQEACADQRWRAWDSDHTASHTSIPVGVTSGRSFRSVSMSGWRAPTGEYALRSSFRVDQGPASNTHARGASG